MRKSASKSQLGEFLDVIFFFSVPDWDDGTKSSISFNHFEPLPIEMSLCNQENLLDVGASLFEYVRTEGCYLNITSKFVAKVNTKTSPSVLKSWKGHSSTDSSL